MHFIEAAKREREESEQVEALQSGLEPFGIPRQAAEAGRPGEGALDDPAADSSMKPRLAAGCFTD